MRGMIVIALASLAVPIAFLSPFLGLLAYCWLSYMRPQDMAWGVGHITFGLYTAVALVAGLLVRMKFDFVRMNRVTVGMLVLWAHWAVCTALALDRDTSLDGFVQISRIFVIGFIASGLCDTKERVQWFAIAMIGSLAFHGTKKGLVGIATGLDRDTNPIGGMMSGNNENGVALNVALPFLVCWAIDESRKWRKLALWSSAALTAVAIMCTYSRGSFLAMAVSTAVLAWKSKSRFTTFGIVLPSAAFLFFLLAPESYLSRIGGIDDAHKMDLSAIWRLQAWGVALDIGAAHPICGIGPKGFVDGSFQFMRPAGLPRLECHSTYFEFIATMGFLGLVLYLGFLLCGWTAAERVQRIVRTTGDERLRSHARLAVACQAALAGYVVSSAFGSLAHFDLPYHVCVLAACIGTGLERHRLELNEKDTEAALRLVHGDPVAPPLAMAGALPHPTRVADTPVAPVAPVARYAEDRLAVPVWARFAPPTDVRSAAESAPTGLAPAPSPAPALRTRPESGPRPPVRRPFVDDGTGTADEDREPDEPGTLEGADAPVALRPAPSPPRRHTGPAAPRDGADPDVPLEELFVDPVGTLGPEDLAEVGRNASRGNDTGEDDTGEDDSRATPPGREDRFPEDRAPHVERDAGETWFGAPSGRRGDRPAVRGGAVGRPRLDDSRDDDARADDTDTGLSVEDADLDAGASADDADLFLDPSTTEAPAAPARRSDARR